MSDTYAAPAPAPAARPPTHEAVINPSPISIPTPIGSQAPGSSRPPDDMQGSEYRPQSRSEQRRDAIKKAFARTTEPGPAKPRMGHNQPPEPMQKEKTAPPPPKAREAKPHPETIDLRKPPPKEGEVSQTSAPRPRAEHGHFAPRGAQNQNLNFAPNSSQSGPQADLYHAPPPRMSRQAQAEWGRAPASVRAEVYRMHRDFSQAHQRYMADRQVMDSIRPYHELARQQGTTLARALGNYVPMEHKLRTDPIGGLDLIVNNLNLRTAQGQPIGLRDIAYYIASQSPEQHQAVRTQNVQTAHQMQIAEMQRQNQVLAKQIQALHYQHRFTRVRSAVDDYATTHPRLDELAGPIERELRLGFDLHTAYMRADRLYPARGPTRGQMPGTAAQTRGVAAGNGTRGGGNRSISGAPASANGATHHPKFKTRREIVAYNMRRVRGQL